MANDEFDVTHLSPVPRNMNTQETRTLNLSPVIKKNAIRTDYIACVASAKKGEGGEGKTQRSPNHPRLISLPSPLSPFDTCHRG